jgi:hypothetical protein
LVNLFLIYQVYSGERAYFIFRKEKDVRNADTADYAGFSSKIGGVF